MTTLALQQTDTYWNLLKNLSDDVKLKLIAMLSNSIVEDKNGKKESKAKSFRGVWSDADYIDADEMINLIKNSRTFKNTEKYEEIFA
ncbi:MAG: hypothetical protein IJ250_05090 [Bacteroidales bacterium]|nr:hypothetical protein [Bacteroidales bacterium]